MQKYLTSLERQDPHFMFQHGMYTLEEYSMMAVQMEEMAQLGQPPHQIVEPTMKMFIVSLHPSYDKCFCPFTEYLKPQ